MNVKYKNSIYIAIFFLVLAAIATGFVWRRNNQEKIKDASAIQDNAISTSTFSVIPISETPEVNIPLPETINRPITISANISEKEKTAYLSKIQEAINNIKENPISYDDWLSLGLYRKAIGDYIGTAEAWKESIKINPGGYISYHNLGDLYHFYIRDFVSAEKYMKDLVRVKPDYISAYRNLFDLYTLSYMEKENEAPKILLDGIAKNPKAYDLMVLLASYYRDQGNISSAKEYYQKALSLNPPNRSAIESEMLGIR